MSFASEPHAGWPEPGSPALDAERVAAAIAHELESSLLVIAKTAEDLRARELATDAATDGGSDLRAERREGLERILRSSDRMRRLLAGVRGLARAQAPVEPVLVAVQEVYEEALETLGPLIEQRSARVSVAGPLPVVVGDRTQLFQLLQNLLSNAVKFGPVGGCVIVSAKRLRGVWQIAVSDEGPGIAPEHRERIFEPFRRLRESGDVPGNGIGLAICRRVAAAHGGSVTVESTPGRGATFLVVLPDRRPRAVRGLAGAK